MKMNKFVLQRIGLKVVAAIITELVRLVDLANKEAQRQSH